MQPIRRTICAAHAFVTRATAAALAGGPQTRPRNTSDTERPGRSQDSPSGLLAQLDAEQLAHAREEHEPLGSGRRDLPAASCDREKAAG